MMDKFKAHLFDVLEIEGSDHKIDNWFERFMFILISLNIICLILETVESIGKPYSQFFYWFDIISLAIFTIEYFLRVWLCRLDPRYKNPITGRLKYMSTGYMLLDLIVILPLLTHFIGIDTRFVLVVRVIRLFRVLKLTRHSQNFARLIRVLKREKDDLVAAAGLVIALVVIASSIMYFAEHAAQPDKFPSIPASMWWGIITLTTIGYGDVYPTTVLGKVVCGFTTLLSIGMVALPAGILSAGFSKELGCDNKCPHCGGDLHE